MRLIEEQYDRPITVQAIARTLGRRATYLSRLFREHRGCGIRAFIVQMRMRHAAKLLLAGERVEAVALIVGYKSRPSFYRQFKEHFGITPLRFVNGSRIR